MISVRTLDRPTPAVRIGTMLSLAVGAWLILWIAYWIAFAIVAAIRSGAF